MKPANYLPNLTPLRGIAALLTVIFHFNIMGGSLFSSPSFINRMYLMVDFFFMLSGFIMCHVYGTWFREAVQKSEFKRFAIARFARVYPLYFVTLVYTIILFTVSSRLGIPKSIVETENSGYSIITNLFLLQSMNLHQWFSWVHASWSISTEWWAYMVFPFLVKPCMKLNGAGRILALLLCIAGYLCITYLLVPIVTEPKELPFVRVNPADLTINVSYQYGFVRCLCGFILGMILYQFYKDEWGKKIFGNGYIILGATALCFICMHFAVPDFITVLFFPIIILSGVYGSNSMDVFLGSKPMQRIGDWSFSIYLVHQPIMFTMGTILSYLNPVDPSKPPQGPPDEPSRLTAWMICIAMIAVILFFSWLTYRFVEVPARKKINTLTHHHITHL